MVFVKGCGQTCNDLLQFGHFYAWGRENGVKTVSMRFCYRYPYFKINHQKGYHFGTYLWAKCVAMMPFFPKVSFDDQDSVTKAKLDRLKKSVYAIAKGWYMRDYEAFLKHREEIREMFSFQAGVTSKVDQLLSTCTPAADVTLGLHVRRGDYARWQDGRYFYADEVYISLIKQFVALHPNKSIRVLIATNDPAIDLERYRRDAGLPVYLLGGNAGEDLYALSQCDYLIGAPSTYSLVASFYRETALYWVLDPQERVTYASFKRFDELFRHII